MAAQTLAIAPDVDTWLGRYAPDVRDAISGLHAASWKSVDPALLQLCRLRLAAMLGDDAEFTRVPAGAPVLAAAKVATLAGWPSSPHFTDAERACLAFTEQFVGDVAGLTDADCAPVLAHLGPEGLYAFVTALLALDGHQRLRLALERVFGPVEGSA